MPHELPRYDPPPDELAERIKEVRDGWTEAQERYRRTGSSVPVPYEIEIVSEDVFFTGKARQ